MHGALNMDNRWLTPQQDHCYQGNGGFNETKSCPRTCVDPNLVDDKIQYYPRQSGDVVAVSLSDDRVVSDQEPAIFASNNNLVASADDVIFQTKSTRTSVTGILLAQAATNQNIDTLKGRMTSAEDTQSMLGADGADREQRLNILESVTDLNEEGKSGLVARVSQNERSVSLLEATDASHDEKLGNLQQDVDDVNARTEEIARNLTESFGVDLDQVKSDLADLQGDGTDGVSVSANHANIQKLNTDLDSLRGDGVSGVSVTSNRERLISLENQTTSLLAELTLQTGHVDLSGTVGDELVAVKNRVDANEGKLNTQTSMVNSLAGDLTDVKNRVTAAEKCCTDNTAAISSLDGTYVPKSDKGQCNEFTKDLLRLVGDEIEKCDGTDWVCVVCREPFSYSNRLVSSVATLAALVVPQ